MYSFIKEDGNYHLMKKYKKIRTPMGQVVTTNFRSLAERLTTDLNTFGESPTDPVSIVAFHYALIDFFSMMPREELERSVAAGLERENDWTFNCPSAEPEYNMKWIGIFGTSTSSASKAKEWLRSLSLIQMCAVCVIGRALESVNIPFIITNFISSNNINTFTKEIASRYHYVSLEELKRIIENYLFYFSIETDS